MLPFLQNADRIWSPESGLEMRPRFWFKIDVSRCVPILESEAQIDPTSVVPANTFHNGAPETRATCATRFWHPKLVPQTGLGHWFAGFE